MTALRSPLRRLLAELYALRRERVLLEIANALKGAVALEPGGPSAIFERLAVTPVYSRLAALDTLDYAEQTLWSGSDEIRVRPRRRLIGEAATLQGIADDSYDAVLASHVIEHIANPLGALAEWKRVVRPGGHVLLVVPHRDGTFDHRRPVTTLEHLRRDADAGTGEDDATHREEVLALHDLDRDPGAPSRAVFEQRVRDSEHTRAIHHHVFVSHTAVEMARAAGLEVLMLHPGLPYNIVCLCRVPGAGASAELSDAQLARILGASPFPSDRAQAAQQSDLTPA